jgi:hypothetical protein
VSGQRALRRSPIVAIVTPGAKVFQIILVVVGLLFIGLGLLGVVTSEGEQKSSAQWTCRPDVGTPTNSTCVSLGSANVDLEAALGYVLVGIGLEAAAAAIAAGSRRPTPQGVPVAYQPYPAMQPGRTAPMGPMTTGQAPTGPMPPGPTSGAPTGPGYPAPPAQRPPWPS